MSDDTITQKENVVKAQNYNSRSIEKAFSPFIDKPIWAVTRIKDKKPIDPKTGKFADISKSHTWATFAQANDYCNKNHGFAPAIALTPSLGLVCIDLDNMYNPADGTGLEIAQLTINRLQTYTEISISKTGKHIFSIASKPGNQTVKNLGMVAPGNTKPAKIEIFDSHFITVTGHTEKNLDILKQTQSQLNQFYEETFKEEKASQTNLKETPPLADEEVLSLCRKAKNGGRFTALFEHGDLSGNNEDASAADIALCLILAFYTQNLLQIDRLFRSSKLMRDKWNRDNYRENTIRKALSILTATYQPTKNETSKNESIKHGLKSVGLGEFLTTPIPEKAYILPWCREQNTIMIHAWRGVGKTLFSLNIAYAIASGGEFLGWKADKPKKVLYVDGEMPATALQERLANIVKRNKGTTPPGEEYFQLLASDQQEMGIPYLDTQEGQDLIQPLVDNADVIIIDNLSTLTCQPENEAQAWLPMQKWVLAQRRANKTLILIHHTGKSGAQRGSSKREDILDIVINLKRPKDYTPEQGARFELHFEKTRGISGKQVRPMDIRIEEKEGILHWIHKELESAVLEQIKELTALGLKDSDIWNELEISRATYFRYKKKLVEPQMNTEI